MISASSSVAASLIGGSSPSFTSSASATADATGDNGNNAYILDGSIGSGGDPFSADFLSNAVFAGITANLLRDPRANGAMTGTASAQVQKIIQAISASVGGTEGASTTSSSTATGATKTRGSSLTTANGAAALTTATATLPAEGVLA